MGTIVPYLGTPCKSVKENWRESGIRINVRTYIQEHAAHWLCVLGMEGYGRSTNCCVSVLYAAVSRRSPSGFLPGLSLGELISCAGGTEEQFFAGNHAEATVGARGKCDVKGFNI
jgi:hypothetical protein